MDTALAATEVKEQVRSHEAPAQSRSPTHRCIRVRDAEYVLVDQVHDLAIEGRLQTVRDMADHFLLHVNRSLADRGIERHRTLDCLSRCLFATDDFNEGDEVRRIEGMSDHAALGMFALRLTNSNRDARRTGSKNGGSGGKRVHVRKQFDLEVRLLRSVLLDQVDALQRFVQFRSERESLL